MLYLCKTIVCLSLILAPGYTCISQETVNGSKENFTEIYIQTREKLDAVHQLLNGIYYENPYYRAKGHPFLYDGEFHKSTIIFQSAKFHDVGLKLDVFHQQIVINPKPDDPMLSILLSNDFVSEFWVNGAHFIKNSSDDAEYVFYQVLWEEEDIKCYQAWFKMRYNSFDDEDNVRYRFSEARQKSYMEINGKLSRYSNNRSFLSLLPLASKNLIRDYMKEKNIRVDKADDHMMKELIQFCQLTLYKTHM